MEFLGSIPFFQQLPSASLKEIASVVQHKELEKLGVLRVDPSEENDLYIVKTGELTRRGLPLKVLSSGDHGTGKELQSAVATANVEFLVIPSKFHGLITKTSIWNASVPEDQLCLAERMLQLEKIGNDVFRGHTLPNIVLFAQMYGGHLVSQALAAASKSVAPFLFVRSFHSSFLVAGDTSVPVTYEVQRLQDSRSLATRMVMAIQKNRIIFTMTASFQRNEDGIEHQLEKPEAPLPEELPPEETVFRSYVTDDRLPRPVQEHLEKHLTKDRPLDVRACDPIDFVKPEKCDSYTRFWFRAKGKLSDDEALHRCVLAYASDWFFFECSLRPHGLSKGPDAVFPSNLLTLSLDHSVWFHKPIKADEWILYTMSSPRASGGRALAMGHMYQNQEMVATVVQQGMARVRSKSKL